MKKRISNWGNYPKIISDEHHFRFEDELQPLMTSNTPIIARGNGRCYGDASLAPNVISTLKFKNILAFDPVAGVITCEAGLTLDQVLDFVIGQGWFLPVTPGTKYVTVGGALVSDVHGKNHHMEGTFGDHVTSFDLIVAGGEKICVTKQTYPELYRATVGGMGLTGLVTTVTFSLKKISSGFIQQKKIKAYNLQDAMDIFEQNINYTYSMAWIDCMRSGDKTGRSLVMLGEHAGIEEIDHANKTGLKVREKSLMNVPFYFPSFVLNKLSINLFNHLYYAKELRKIQDTLIGYDSFFYPLDAIINWNRMYGKPGFLQYQFVLPMESSREGLLAVLKKIAQHGAASFLAVLKLFGEQNANYLSFPKKGYTLALDFPIKNELFPFLDELDRMVLDYGGRIYLSKDARMKASIFKDSYPQLNEFAEVVRKYNPGKFESMLSNRLFKDIL